ncbi:MAG: hypothetical protein SGBAC_010950 [Bacillariaceae sp.]
MVSSLPKLDFSSSWRINFAGEDVQDLDVAEEELFLRKVPPERKSVFTFDADPQKPNGRKVYWFWKNADEKRPKRPKRSSDDSSSFAIGSQFLDLDWDSDDFELDSDAHSDSDTTFVSMGTKDTTRTYGTKGTYATVNTKQYVEFLIQEKQEYRWNAFFCGVCGRVTDEDEEMYSVSSIYTRSKPQRTYDTEPHRILSVFKNATNGDPDESQGLGSQQTGETKKLAPLNETSFIF